MSTHGTPGGAVTDLRGWAHLIEPSGSAVSSIRARHAHALTGGAGKGKPNPGRLGLVSSVPSRANPLPLPHPTPGTPANGLTRFPVEGGTPVEGRTCGRGVSPACGARRPRPQRPGIVASHLGSGPRLISGTGVCGHYGVLELRSHYPRAAGARGEEQRARAMRRCPLRKQVSWVITEFENSVITTRGQPAPASAGSTHKRTTRAGRRPVEGTSGDYGVRELRNQQPWAAGARERGGKGREHERCTAARSASRCLGLLRSSRSP